MAIGLSPEHFVQGGTPAHYPLRGQDSQISQDTEILTRLDDCARMALRVTAHQRVTAPIVLAEFRQAIKIHGIPAFTLTDNGMVFTVRLAGIGRQGGQNKLEAELRRLHMVQKNGKPNHPTTQGKVERFQQTMKKWLRAQPIQPATIEQLQRLLDTFVDEYNYRLHHIGVGRTHARTHVILLIQDLNVRVVNAITGELLRELTIDPERDYQGRDEIP